jgi:hypothetical protein
VRETTGTVCSIKKCDALKRPARGSAAAIFSSLAAGVSADLAIYWITGGGFRGKPSSLANGAWARLDWVNGLVDDFCNCGNEADRLARRNLICSYPKATSGASDRPTHLMFILPSCLSGSRVARRLPIIRADVAAPTGAPVAAAPIGIRGG